mmetsp:Transcript_30549/g.71333  ORF Transcript_30549/g.71333 Transcript_30549/m.71333 type:complete len:274 (-) Transcript_30549:1493-2314(-)
MHMEMSLRVSLYRRIPSNARRSAPPDHHALVSRIDPQGATWCSMSLLPRPDMTWAPDFATKDSLRIAEDTDISRVLNSGVCCKRPMHALANFVALSQVSVWATLTSIASCSASCCLPWLQLATTAQAFVPMVPSLSESRQMQRQRLVVKLKLMHHKSLQCWSSLMSLLAWRTSHPTTARPHMTSSTCSLLALDMARSSQRIQMRASTAVTTVPQEPIQPQSVRPWERLLQRLHPELQHLSLRHQLRHKLQWLQRQRIRWLVGAQAVRKQRLHR